MPLAERLLAGLKSRRLALVRQADGPPSLQFMAAQACQEEGLTDPVPEAVVQSLPVDASLRVAVLGNASGSMQVCVEAACTAGAIIAAVLECGLVFFNEKAFRAASPCPKQPPRCST